MNIKLETEINENLGNLIIHGNMQIGNIHWKHCRLETKFLDWKHDYEIGNKKNTLAKMNLDWKQNSQIGNTESRLEAQIVDWKPIFLEIT